MQRILIFEIDAEGATCGPCAERSAGRCKLFNVELLAMDLGRYVRAERCLEDEGFIDDPEYPETAAEQVN